MTLLSTQKNPSDETKTETGTGTDTRLRFHEIVETDEKKVPVVSTASLALKLLVVVPIWMILVLPLTIAYQLGKSVIGGGPGNNQTETAPGNGNDNDDDDTTAAPRQSLPEDFVPRPDRKYDVVVLGATGFTGGLAVRHLAKTYGAPCIGKDGPVRWAIAGRSLPKLEAVLAKLSDELGMPELTAARGAVDCIVCDTSDPSTLPALVRDTRSVATTAGPFSLYGEPVVASCARYGTHYADITGETSFVKSMVARHRDTAKATGARILSLCGNDCVPWDLSYNLLADKFRAAASSGGNADDDNNNNNDNKETLERVEFANEFSSSASGGTLKTMCMGLRGGLATAPDDTILRKSVGSETEHPEPMENKISYGIRSNVPKPWTLGEKKHGGDGGGSLVEAPFVMSGVNYEAVGWSHALRREARCSYKEQLLLPDFSTALDGILGLVVFFTALMNPVTGSLLENYLVTKPGDGPGLKEMTEDYFLAVTGTAYGSKGSVYQSLLYFDKDPGYLETSRMVVECALCLALEEDTVSEHLAEALEDPKQGGFFTPGFALRNTLLERLVDTGCQYEFRVVKEAE
eukprot:jgi/Psemu1/203535/e_gw1.324.28.1